MDKSTRFTQFTQELAKLSAKYGIAIQSMGGVCLYDNPKDLEGICYSRDHTSGDLSHNLPNDSH